MSEQRPVTMSAGLPSTVLPEPSPAERRALAEAVGTDAERRRDAVERLMATDVVRRLAEGDEAGARELAHRVLDVGVAA